MYQSPLYSFASIYNMIVHAYDLFHLNVGALGIKRLNNDHLKIERPSAGNQGNGPLILPKSLNSTLEEIWSTDFLRLGSPPPPPAPPPLACLSSYQTPPSLRFCRQCLKFESLLYLTPSFPTMTNVSQLTRPSSRLPIFPFCNWTFTIFRCDQHF